MRILFASTGGAGHFIPLIPWIDQISATATKYSWRPTWPCTDSRTVEFPLRVGAFPPAEKVAKIWAQVATMKHDDAGSLVIGDIFCPLNSGALLPAVRATCESSDA